MSTFHFLMFCHKLINDERHGLIKGIFLWKDSLTELVIKIIIHLKRIKSLHSTDLSNMCVLLDNTCSTDSSTQF